MDIRVAAEHYADDGAGRAESLAHCIRVVLDKGGFEAAQLSGIAVVDGPGSYTAVRVGLALARGIALVDGLRVAPFGSLELIARAIEHETPVCALLDAGQGKLYAAGYAPEHGVLREVREPVIVAASALNDEVRAWTGEWTICGDRNLAGMVALDVFAPAERAAHLACAGLARLAFGDGLDAETVLPRYVGATGARPNPRVAPVAVLMR
jgi:tRNA threonylcarbamoyl adenosine modification protein YeaZ